MAKTAAAPVKKAAPMKGSLLVPLADIIKETKENIDNDVYDKMGLEDGDFIKIVANSIFDQVTHGAVDAGEMEPGSDKLRKYIEALLS